MINGETLALLCTAVDTRRGSRDNGEAARIIKQSEHPSWATATTFSRLIRCWYFIWYCGAWKHLGRRNTYVIKQVMWLVLVHFVIWNGNRKHGDCGSHAAVWHQHHREPRPGWHQNRQAFMISIILESSPSLELSTLTINTVTSKILLWNWIIRHKAV